MFWASEVWMFGAVSRKIKLWDGGDKKEVYYPLRPDVLVSFTIKPAPGKDEPRFTYRETPIKPADEVRSYQQNFTGSGAGSPSSRQNWTSKEQDGKVVHLRNNTGGGQVTSPFVDNRGQDDKAKETVRRLLDKLDDPLPALPPPANTQTAGESTNTSMADVEFLRNSLKTSASTQPSTRLRNSSQSSGYPQPSNSGSSPQSNKSVSSGASVGRCDNTTFRGPRAKISLRKVAGIDYITDNSDGHEISVMEFDKLTGSVCSFCRTPIGGLEEVSEFLTRRTFICKSCVSDELPTPSAQSKEKAA
jgi:hypothetical protein